MLTVKFTLRFDRETQHIGKLLALDFAVSIDDHELVIINCDAAHGCHRAFCFRSAAKFYDETGEAAAALAVRSVVGSGLGCAASAFAVGSEEPEAGLFAGVERARGVRLRAGRADAVFAGGVLRVDFRGTRIGRPTAVTGSGVVVVAVADVAGVPVVAVVSVVVGDGDGCGCAALDSSVVSLTSSGNRAPVAETRLVPLPRADETSGARVVAVAPEASAASGKGSKLPAK